MMKGNMPAIGIDIGGTSTRVALVDREGKILAREQEETAPQKGTKAFVNRTVEAVRRISRQADEPVYQIGIGCPGPLNPFSGTLLDPPNLPGWDGFALKKELETATGLSVTLDNDASAAALGEARFGAGAGQSSTIYITLSTGIGAGIVINGRLFSGATGNAGEIGNMIVQPGGERFGTLNAGALEGLASGTAIGREGKRKLGLDGKAETVFTKAEKGNRYAEAIIEEAAGYLAIAVANLANSFDPAVFVFGGGVMQQERMLPLLKEKTVPLLYPSMQKTLRLTLADLGQSAGVIGAALLPMYRE
ncbi:glucose kinase [Alteribacter lacisalsi]|uniref:Glucose kinase n=1 Tax=Alteribacter lacisalsi TaxID=2045244 RepID=A0A2W0HGA5_9BACI|nr:ROK family protein [Alteribacter lacisalsi]PYZ95839.1 glucose kinase [Alteribacter lacisalsi]